MIITLRLGEAEAVTQQYKKSTALSQLQQRHPDMQNVLQDQKFVDWIQGSKIRKQLFAQADKQYDYDAADDSSQRGKNVNKRLIKL